MNYCIYLRKRKNKPYCKLIDKEITFSRCRECDNKQYKNKPLQTSAELCKSNNNQIRKSSGFKKKSPLKSGTMRVKSNKILQLERNRFSVFSDNKRQCMFCYSTSILTWHEIFSGRNRLKSMKYGFCLRMCLKCHSEKQENIEFNDFWHRQAQLYFEENIGSREDFLAEFKRNYIIEKKSKH